MESRSEEDREGTTRIQQRRANFLIMRFYISFLSRARNFWLHHQRRTCGRAVSFDTRQSYPLVWLSKALARPRLSLPQVAGTVVLCALSLLVAPAPGIAQERLGTPEHETTATRIEVDEGRQYRVTAVQGVARPVVQKLPAWWDAVADAPDPTSSNKQEAPNE